MRPAYAPTGAGRGDAVSGINRADSASVSGNDPAPTSSGPQPQWSTAAGTRRPGIRQRRQHCGRPDSPRFVQATYPPPRESCVRGADRAAVDKPRRSECGMQLWAGWRNAPDDLAKVQIGRFVEQRIARHADGTHERPDGKPAQCASREPRDEEVEVQSIPLELAS